ncbi:BlaI/MecI/CopY family transcriptional regulator [Deinococcus radiopugnans]|nr:BlaI/MecI/CopY family transcriptional regulator [Deinococcus radiopugnans]MBB6015991.1 putative transcriptional regulator [Deinococcus radiopugnans ATCC 19172]
MTPASSLSGLGPLEQRVMEVLWTRAPRGVTAVQAELGGESAYSTVKTILERLTDKGYLLREKVGKAFEYRPAISRTELEVQGARRLSERLLSGFGSAALTQFVDTVKEDPAQLTELRRLLTELEEQ